jgi:hypothetical protein
MFKWTTLVYAGLACYLTLPALNAGFEIPCPPPLTPDYVKKTVRVEIKGKLSHFSSDCRGPREFDYRMPNITFWDVWQVTVSGKTYTLRFDERKDVTELANKLVNKTVIVTGTLDETTVGVTGLTADEDYVKEKTEVEARGQLQVIRSRMPNLWDNTFDSVIVGLNFVVDGKTYNLELTPEQWKLVETLDGKAVILTGVLDKDSITVKTLRAAA